MTLTATTTAARLPSRDLFVTLVERQLRLRAKRSVMGVVWPVLAPLFLLALYSFVFASVFEVPIDDYPVYLFAGLLPWTMLAQTLGVAVQSLSLEPELIRRSPFRYELLPISVTVTMALYFFFTLVVFVAWLAVFADLRWALLPVLAVPVVALLLLVAAASMVVALVDVYNRDLRLVLGNLLTVWFFLVPVVYRPDMAPGALQALRSVDPMNMIVGQFRDILLFGKVSRPGHLVLMLVACGAVYAVAVGLYRAVGHRLPRDV